MNTSRKKGNDPAAKSKVQSRKSKVESLRITLDAGRWTLDFELSTLKKLRPGDPKIAGALYRPNY